MFSKDTIETENEAYILGFLYADGFVTGKYKRLDGMRYGTIASCISIKDRDILIKIAKLFTDVGYKVHLKERSATTKGKVYPTYYMGIYNVELVQRMIHHGIRPQKTYEDSSYVFDKIPENLKRHFVRGYFDGDGSIYHGKNSNKRCIKIISLNVSLMLKIDEWILSNCNLKIKTNHHYKLQDGKYPRISHNGNPNCKKIGKLLYDGATIFLDRKKKSFDEIPEIFIKSSKYPGVRWNKQRNKWQVSIYIDKNNQRVYCGLYYKEEEANQVYLKRKKEIKNEYQSGKMSIRSHKLYKKAAFG